MSNCGIFLLPCPGGGNVMCACTKRVCVSITEPKACTVAQLRRVHLFFVNCLLKNKFNIHYTRNIYLRIQVNTIKPNFHAKNIIWSLQTNRYSSLIIIDDIVLQFPLLLCVCTKRVSVCDNELVCKASATSFLMPDQRHFPSLYSYSLIIPL